MYVSQIEGGGIHSGHLASYLADVKSQTGDVNVSNY